jgi:hypothetical protein
MKFDFDPSLIDRMGIEMYDSPTRVIAEMISNSWDADADKVHISLPDGKIDEKSVIRIVDDGFGMSKEDVQKKFVQIGLDKRKSGERSPIKNRPLMGKKGIGKFACFGVCDIAEVFTVREGRCFGFSMDINEMHKCTSLKDYEIEILFDDVADKMPKEIEGVMYIDKDTGKPKGTVLTLKNLRDVQRNPGVNTLLESLAMRFRLVPDFQIYVNETPVKEIKIKNQKVLQIDELVEKEIELENGKKIIVKPGTVKGFIALAKDTVRFPWGVSIFVKGRTVELNTDFNISKGFTGQIYTAYLHGELEAEWIDAKERDIISTDRGGIRWDTIEGKALEKWGQEKIRKICEMHAKETGIKKIKTWELKPQFSSRLMRFAPEYRREVERSIKLVIERAVGTPMEKHIDFMIDLFLLAFENRDILILLKKFHETGIDNIKEFSKLLDEWSIVELTHLAQVIKGRLELVDMLKDYYENPGTPEKTMQGLLETYPWLINPTYDILSANEVLSKTLNEMCIEELKKEHKVEKLTDEQLRKRPDYVCLGALGKWIVIEIKKPRMKADIKAVSQLERYLRYICRELSKKPPDVTGLLIAHDFNEEAQLQIDNNTAISGTRYKDLWRQARNLHKEFLDILEKKKDEASKVIFVKKDSKKSKKKMGSIPPKGK